MILAAYRGEGQPLNNWAKILNSPVKLTSGDIGIFLKPAAESEPLIQAFVKNQLDYIKGKAPVELVSLGEIIEPAKSAEFRLVVVAPAIDDPKNQWFINLSLINRSPTIEPIWEVAKWEIH